MWRHVLLLAALALSLPLVPASAEAGEREWSAEADGREAKGKALYRRAIRLDRDGDYRGALDTLLAYREYANPEQFKALDRWESDLRRSLGLQNPEPRYEREEPRHEREPEPAPRYEREPEPTPQYEPEPEPAAVMFAAPASIDITFDDEDPDDEYDPYEDESVPYVEPSYDGAASYEQDSYEDGDNAHAEDDAYPDEYEDDAYDDEYESSSDADPQPLDLKLAASSRSARRVRAASSLAPNPAGPVLIVSGSSLAAGFGVAAGVTWNQGAQARSAGDKAGYEATRPANNAAFAASAVGGALLLSGITAAIVDGITKKKRRADAYAEYRP
ncbi:MAG: hypothetical protein KDA24_02940 [Deltaproteobacteria bacterium]|nr:hypothetical protein [Deltaproteobacteria bacterium]